MAPCMAQPICHRQEQTRARRGWLHPLQIQARRRSFLLTRLILRGGLRVFKLATQQSFIRGLRYRFALTLRSRSTALTPRFTHFFLIRAPQRYAASPSRYVRAVRRSLRVSPTYKRTYLTQNRSPTLSGTYLRVPRR